MRIFLLVLLALPTGALADSAYQTSRLCASAQDLKAPPAPAAACASLRPTHAALMAYARDVVGSCMQLDRRLGAAKEGERRGCAAAPGSDACGQSLVSSDGEYAAAERELGAVKARNEKPVMASFPAQGQGIASACLPVLDAYQQFAYAVSAAANDAARVSQGERSSLRQKVASIVKNRSATSASTMPQHP